MERPLIIAHRGAPGRRRENTVAGFLAAIVRGADWIELDVHQTADGNLIVYHDFVIGEKPVCACTVGEAKRLARSVRQIALPTLDEVLEAMPDSIALNVEIKPPGIGPAVVAALTRHRAARRTVCTSFHFPTVQALANLRPRVKTGILTRSRLHDPVAAIRRARAQALFQHYRSVAQRSVQVVQKAGFQFFVWTVNRERDLKRMVELGVDGIITDYPEKLARLLGGMTRTPRANRVLKCSQVSS